jgi:anaerobic nitric oxide reductase transcription regulator
MTQPASPLDIGAQLDTLLAIARDLTASLASEDRYARLLDAVTRLIPCDAACLLRLEGDDLVPVSARGLVPEALSTRFPRREHPRLEVILSSDAPVRFPVDSALPDPFDGLIEGDPHALEHVHACLGARLVDAGQVVGALTADSLSPHAFDDIHPRILVAIAALAGAAMRTTSLIEALERVAERRGAVARDLQRAASQTSGGELLGSSAAARRLIDEIRLVAGSDLAVLVMGETGVGKELVVRRIHELSARRDEPLIQVNCAALPESIAESELFGHVAGAFTGAARERAGKFEIADGGTLFLDEVGELPLTLQPKLLRALQSGEIQRVGADRVRRVNVRILAATNRSLEYEVASGHFRADLYHRLAAYPIRVPPLRERREDVPALAAHFIDVGRRRLGLGPVRLTDEAREALVEGDWPGNVRELENVIARGVLRAARAHGASAGPIRIQLEHLDVSARRDGGESGTDAAASAASEAVSSSGAPLPLADRVEAFRRREIEAAVERNGGNWAAAARDLGLHRSNLHHLAKRLGLRE